MATVYINAGEAAQLAALGLVATPIDNPGTPGSSGHPEQCSGWPTYDALVLRMQNLAANYPDIVRMVSIGKSWQNRDLWVLQITDNPDVEEDEPEFRYVSTMHGNEGAGAEMILRLAELLTANYGTDPYYTQLVDEIEIWLWPLFNPDGYMACSYGNDHGVNLNRDFPDRWDDPPINSPDGRQPETQAAWYWEEAHTFVMGANYHSGALVANIPWDAITGYESPDQTYAPDDELYWRFAEGYTWRNQDMWNGGWTHGWTRGWEWYQIWGGMQDWAYHWYGEHHITLEISDWQPPPYNQMDSYWNKNRDAMLWWMERVLTGARGLVTDACTGAPLDASVDVVEIGKPVPTDPDVGDYHRLLLTGSYTLIASAPGYPSQQATVEVISGTAATVQHFRLAGGTTDTIQGTVTDATSGAPLAATVEVELDGTPIVVTTTNPADGHYTVELCPDTYLFRVSAPFHQTEEREVVVDGDGVEDFALVGYDVAAGSSERAGAPGETVTHTVAVTNTGGMTDTYNVTLTPGDWPAALLTPQLGPLAPGAAGQALVAVQIPPALLTSTVLFSDVLGLEIISQAAPDVGAEATGTTYGIADLAVALGTLEDSLGGPAGGILTYTLRLTNTGGYTDSYTLLPLGNAWTTTVAPPLIAALAPGASAPVLVRVEIPGTPAAPTDTVTIRAASGWDDTIRAHQTLYSAVLGAAVAAADSTAYGTPGEVVTHTLWITNAGSIADTYAITLEPGAWPADLLTPQVTLQPGESGAAQVAVSIPYQPLSATLFVSDTFALDVTSTVAPGVGARAAGATYAAIVLDVALGADRTSGFGLPGEVITYALAVTNVGAYTDSYTLAALPGSAWGGTVAPTQTGALAPGESAQAVLWVSVPRGSGGSDVLTVRAASAWAAGVYGEIELTTGRGWGIFLPLVAK